MAATNGQVLDRWFEEVGRKETHLLRRGGTHFVNSEGVLYYDREGRGAWGRGRPARNIRLAKFIGARYNGGFCLLNGDGLEDQDAQMLQARIRERAQSQFGIERCPIIPWSALDAATLDYNSIKLIEVTRDRDEIVPVVYHQLAEAIALGPEILTAEHKWGDQVHGTVDQSYRLSNALLNNSTRVEGRWRGSLFLLDFRKISDRHTPDDWQIRRVWVYEHPENSAQLGWQEIEFMPQEGAWVWNQRVHRLGAVVFSAKDAGGTRSRWVSAFDTQEPEPLYYLAQLPSQGSIKTYDDALYALAPPIVHAARAAGKTPQRQGDIFAVPLDPEWDDEKVYAGAKTRVRREVAMQDPRVSVRAGVELIPALEGEITGTIPCPCGYPKCNGKIKDVGCCPEAIQALLVHGTTHTASEVVTYPDGRTFIRGTMFHDPQLETVGREREHANVVLDGDGWYLCVRNTVPRQKQLTTTAIPSRISLEAYLLQIGPLRGSERQARLASPNLLNEVYLPSGWEFTGEIRFPLDGESWLANGGEIKTSGHPTSSQNGGRRHILRRKEVPVINSAAA